MTEKRALRCRLGFHDWRVTNYPAVQYLGISSYAGTFHCSRSGCTAFRYWTLMEEVKWDLRRRGLR